MNSNKADTKKKVFTYYHAIYKTYPTWSNKPEVVYFDNKQLLEKKNIDKEKFMTFDDWSELRQLIFRYLILDTEDELLIEGILNDKERDKLIKELNKEDLDVEDYINLLNKEDFDDDNFKEYLWSMMEDDILSGDMYFIELNDEEKRRLLNDWNIIIYKWELFDVNLLIVPVLQSNYGFKSEEYSKWYAINSADYIKELQKHYDFEIKEPTKLQKKLLEVLNIPLQFD